MALSERENILRCYRHEMPDHLPDISAMHIMTPVHGFDERPPFNQGGKDWFGVNWVFEETGNAPLPDPFADPIVTDISKWREQVVFPDLDAWDWQKALELDDVASIDRENKVFSIWILNGIFERVQTLLGMEETFIALITDPDEVGAFISAVTDYKIKLYAKVVEYYKPDIICQHDDYGTQRSMILSPELWRRLIKPNTARLVEACNRLGVIYEQHSCGLVEPIVEDLAEVGVASWQGQHINDIPALKEKTAGRLNYFTTMDMQKISELETLGKLDEAGLRKLVRETLMGSAPGGCYIPFLYSTDPDWWGMPVMLDELAICSREITY